MEFEPGRLLLFHQSAAADRRGNHPLYGAGTTSHRICTTAGNDCVICPKEHTQPCTDTLNMLVIQYTSSQLKCSFPEEYELIEYKSGWFVSHIYKKKINICFSCILKAVCRSSCLAICFYFLKMGNNTVPQMTSLFSKFYKSTFTEDIKGFLNVTVKISWYSQLVTEKH